jgi:hypothetical protein
MIIEKRVYELKPGAMHGFLDKYENEGLALQRDVLGNLIGYFVTEVGELNRVVQLWGFSSFEDRAKRRAQLSAMPEWKTFIRAAGQDVVSQHSELLTPATFSPIK